MTDNVLRIGDGAALMRKLSYYKLVFDTSKMVKLAILPHYCQYDVSTRFLFDFFYCLPWTWKTCPNSWVHNISAKSSFFI